MFPFVDSKSTVEYDCPKHGKNVPVCFWFTYNAPEALAERMNERPFCKQCLFDHYDSALPEVSVRVT